tara:strand:- start:1008 stop:1589 length:582 start_codon:yes stop_codon:yes gene_type:complete
MTKVSKFSHDTLMIDVAGTFSETAIFPEQVADTYLKAGVVSEAGEFLNVAKKVIRGDASLEEHLPRIVDEFGDIVWYAVMLCSWNDNFQLVDTLGSFEKLADSYRGFLEQTPAPECSDEFFVEVLLEMVLDLIEQVTQDAPSGTMMRTLAEMGAHLSYFASEDVGLCESSSRVAAKLQDRMSRQAIKGDGDDR